MKPELSYLAWTAALTAILWIPYVLERIKTWGLLNAVGYPANPPAQAPWALRMKAAHANAIENLAVFATLVLVAEIAGVANGTTALAAAIYFWARLVHVVAYTAGIPWVRTLAFAGGFVAQVMVALQLLAR
jgi:uncharacterized MAPEG superfamily protein